MGVEKARQLQGMIININLTNKSVPATVTGLITVLPGAKGVFVELQKELNVIREPKDKPHRAIFTVIRTRLFSFGFILSVDLLLSIPLIIYDIIAIYP